MNILGISAGFHDAGVSFIYNEKILFAAHAERYSGVKHDKDINAAIMAEALKQGTPDIVAYYELPWLKKTRQLYAGQYKEAFATHDLTVERYLQHMLGDLQCFSSPPKFVHVPHHLSHAAAGFQTSPYDEATVVVIDAIGEWDTATIWAASYDKKGKARYKKLWSKRYPNSIGLWYSAVTQWVGLRPLDEEYILMGMAGWGKKVAKVGVAEYFLDNVAELDFNHNYHIGLPEGWPVNCTTYDTAATAQAILEDLVYAVMQKAGALNNSKNLVYMGGVALNCSANRNLGNYFDNIWIMPNPGDCGSSLGAAAYVYGKRLDWQHPYLGTHVGVKGAYPITFLIHQLTTKKIVGVAHGRAEFGPRALGNRSLLADPRGPEIKDKVNAIKQRQKFRPFAPVILEEYADLYFEMPKGFPTSPYMQAVAPCRYPDDFPAIIHVDGTSRVQTVPKDSASGIRQLLEEWYRLTGCPMLLNTSLNIRGAPMVNTREDADQFEELYGVKVFS